MTTPSGSTFRIEMDLRKALARTGGGTYTIRGAIVDADELDDADSNVVQLTF
jgi:hypothetical protein